MAAIQSLKNCIRNIGVEKINQVLLNPLYQLLSDSTSTVRSGVAETLGEMSQVLGKDTTNQRISTMVNELMKDDNHEVRLRYELTIVSIR